MPPKIAAQRCKLLHALTYHGTGTDLPPTPVPLADLESRHAYAARDHGHVAAPAGQPA